MNFIHPCLNYSTFFRFSEEEDLYPPGEEPLPPHLRDAPDNSAGAPPANPGCEPACDIDDDIQVGVLF